MGRGRRTTPKLVKGMEGSELAKQRLETILETFAGTLSVNDACARLGMGPSAFHKLRAKALSSALGSLEPGTVGRPRRRGTDTDKEVSTLEGQITELRLDLEAARLREELAIAMPHVLEPRPEETKAKKKKPIRSIRKRHGKRK